MNNVKIKLFNFSYDNVTSLQLFSHYGGLTSAKFLSRNCFLHTVVNIRLGP